MTTETFTMGNRIKLSGMMFLQYMLLPVWFLPLAKYLGTLDMSPGQMAWIMSSMALGCLTSPLVGMVADRHFASERVLATLNLAVAVLLVVAAQVTAPLPVFILLLAVMLCYMPTWGLTSAIAMGHSPSEQFPQIRVFGSIGWVASGIFSLVASYGFSASIDGTVTTLYCGAATALVAAIFSLTLPHTPPPAKGQPASVLDALGLHSLVLMKDAQFAIFMICYFLVMIPFSIYWSFFSLFLEDKGFEFITITMNWGQVAEMIFMLAVPLAIARVGLKWAMTIGLAMLVVRYASLLLGEMMEQQALYFLAILVHGLIFGFFFVGGQIYTDRKAPKELKAQAQGFLFLAGFGLGLLVGNYANGKLLEYYTVSEAGAKVYDWQPIWMITTACSVVLLLVFMALFHDNPGPESETSEDEASDGSSEQPAAE
jgi:nucleoside transporter